MKRCVSVVSADFETTVILIENTRVAADLFGTDNPSRRYRELAMVVHPDRAPTGRKAEATRVFARLSELWANRTVTITSKVGTYTVGERLSTDALVQYLAGRDHTDVILKIARSPVDNDLLRREYENLTTVRLATEDKFSPYLPELVDSFPYRDTATGADRHVNVFTAMPNLYSLTSIRKAFPDGLDGRHVAWIWRRLLVAIGISHKAGVVHGAVVPDHVLIEPDQHGLVLSNWCYSAHGAQRVPALVDGYRGWYPEVVVRKQVPTSSVDVVMATRSVLSLLEIDAPKSLYAFGQRCLGFSKANGAWELLSELDKILEQTYGKRKFVEFPSARGTAVPWPAI